MTGGTIWTLMQLFYPLRTTPMAEIPMPESLHQGIPTAEIHTAESLRPGIRMGEIHTAETLSQGIRTAAIHTVESLRPGIRTGEIHTGESRRPGIPTAESPTEILMAIMIRMTLMRGTIRQPMATTRPLLDTTRPHITDFLRQVWEESSLEAVDCQAITIRQRSRHGRQPGFDLKVESWCAARSRTPEKRGKGGGKRAKAR